MYVFISILILIASILLILIVLIQNSKGGGLASGFSSSNQIMGVRKTTDFLEKATWTLAGTVVVLSIVITAFIPRAQHANQSEIKEQINNAVTIRLLLTLALPSNLRQLPFLLLKKKLQLTNRKRIFDIMKRFPATRMPLFLFCLIELSISG